MATKPKPAAKKAAKPAVKPAVKKAPATVVKPAAPVKPVAAKKSVDSGDKLNKKLDKAVATAKTIAAAVKAPKPVVKKAAPVKKPAAKKVAKIDKLTKVADVPLTGAQKSLASVAAVALQQRHQSLGSSAVRAAAPVVERTPEPTFQRPAARPVEELPFKERLRQAHSSPQLNTQERFLSRLRVSQNR